MISVDYLIVGAGIIGLSVAKELKARRPKSKVLVLEKEMVPGLHSSGSLINNTEYSYGQYLLGLMATL